MDTHKEREDKEQGEKGGDGKHNHKHNVEKL
jgi:hypothetical protein